VNNSGADFRDLKSIHVSRRLVHVVLGQYLLEHLKGLVKCVSVLIKAKCSEQISEHFEQARSTMQRVRMLFNESRVLDEGVFILMHHITPAWLLRSVCEDSYLTMFT